MDSNLQFWVVWRESSGVFSYIPSFKHLTAHEAQREAERLAQMHPGSQFHVLKALRYAFVPPTQPVNIMTELQPPSHVDMAAP